METVCCCLPWVKRKTAGAIIPLESSIAHETTGKDETIGGAPNPQYDLENQLGRAPIPPPEIVTHGPPLSTDLGRGLKILYNPDSIVVDIIAIHGLNGHREKTFTAANNVCWLQSLLPKEFPNARVMSYGYDARTHSSEPLTQEYIHGHSEQFVEDVTDIRMDTGTMRVPIIFVAHSLGGLVLKNALTLSSSYNERHREDQMAFKISTYGIMFMGTPHSGGQGVTLGILAINIASIWFKTNTQLLKHLETNSEWLDQTQMRYLPIASDFDTKFFYEGLETPTVASKSLLIVPKNSACIPGAQDTVNIRIDKNHVDMVKYADAADEDYQKIRRHLKVMVGKAVAKVDGNWVKRENEKRATGTPHVSYCIPLEMPFPPNANFTGRIKEIIKIHKILQRTVADRPHRKAVVLYGMGGVGKTQIATHYAYIHRESYTSIWYLNAESNASLVEGVTRIAQKLVQFHARQWGTDYASIARVVGMRADTIDNGTGKVITTAIALEAVKSWLGAEGNPDWLIVVDNYDDLDNVNVFSFLPNTNTGNLIITSRKRSSARLGEDIEVNAIEKEEGIELIRKSAHRSETQFEEEKEFAAVLVEKLMSLPLSLDLAGSFVFESSISFKDYLTRFDDEFPSLMGSQPPKAVWQYEKTTFTTWEISFQRLGEQAQKLLLLCGFFNNDEISLEILLPKEKIAEFGIDAVDTAIREILSLSLAQRRVDTNALWIHPSVHRWSRERIGTNHRMLATEAIVLTAHAIMCAPLDRKPENWILERQLMPHLHACIDHACRENYVEGLPSETELLGNMFTLAHALSENHDLVKANIVFDWLLPRMKNSQGEEGGDTLFTMHYMAHALSSQGRYREALQLAQRVLAGREKVLGKDHHDTLESLHDVAYYFKQLGNNVEALKWYSMALEAKERVHGPEAPSTLGTVTNMAVLMDSQGEHGKAMEMYLRALAGQQLALGDEHPTTLNTMHSIGLCYFNQGIYGKALEWNYKSLEGRKRVLGMDHQHTLTTVNNIGLIFKKQGKYTEALQWYQQALSGREKSLGSNHPETLTTLNNIALLLQSDGKYEESLPWHKRALDGREKTLGKDHRLTLQSYNNIASLYFYMKRYEDAMKWHEETLAGRERVFGKDHFSTIKTVENMAVTFEMQGKYQDAVKMFERVFDWKKNSPSTGQADLRKTKDQLSECRTRIMESQNKSPLA